MHLAFGQLQVMFMLLGGHVFSCVAMVMLVIVHGFGLWSLLHTPC